MFGRLFRKKVMKPVQRLQMRWRWQQRRRVDASIRWFTSLKGEKCKHGEMNIKISGKIQVYRLIWNCFKSNFAKKWSTALFFLFGNCWQFIFDRKPTAHGHATGGKIQNSSSQGISHVLLFCSFLKMCLKIILTHC